MSRGYRSTDDLSRELARAAFPAELSDQDHARLAWFAGWGSTHADWLRGLLDRVRLAEVDSLTDQMLAGHDRALLGQRATQLRGRL